MTATRGFARLAFLLGVAALFPSATAAGQQPAATVIRGELTAKDPPDRLRKASRAKLHEMKLQADIAYLIDLRSSVFDPYLRLEDGRGKVLGENDDISPTDLNARLGFVPKQSGTFRLVATSFQGGQTGTYELHVRPLQALAKPTELQGKLTAASPQTSGKQAFGLYGVPMESGRVYWLEAESPAIDLSLLVLAGQGKTLAHELTAKGPVRLPFLPPVAGVYRVGVVARQSGATGAYRFRITPYALAQPEKTVEGPPEEIVLPEAPPTVDVGQLTEKDAPDRVLKGSRHKAHVVRLEKGKAYLIELRSGAFDTFLRLEDERGQELADDDNSGGDNDAQVLFTPPQTGTYRLIATSLRGHALGWYTVAVERFATAKAGRRRLAQQQRALALTSEVSGRYRRGDYAGAYESSLAALAMLQKLYPASRYPDGHPLVATSLNNLSAVQMSRGEYGAAEKPLRQALALYQKLYPAGRFPDGHPLRANSLHNLGMLLQARGESGAAEQALREALAMRQKLYPAARFPDGHPFLAQSLNSLGAPLRQQAKYAAAEEILASAVAMNQKLYPPGRFPDGHADLASSLNGLGELLQVQGKYAAAGKHYRQALAMRQKLYPPARFPDGHPLLAETLNNLGLLLGARGENGAAERNLREALAMRQRLYRPSRYPGGHPHLALSLSNLGDLLGSCGDYRAAEEALRQALAMYQKLYPPGRFPNGHPDLAMGLNNLAALLKLRGDYGAAEEPLRQAVAMYQRLYPQERYPDGHHDLAAGLSNLGSLLEARGEYGAADKPVRQALAMLRKLHPPARFPDGHPDLARGLHNLGTLLQARREYAAAGKLYREALAMKQKLYPPARYPDGHPQLVAALNSLGLLMHQSGDYAAAERHYRQGLALCEKLYPPTRYPDGHRQLANNLNNLGVLLQARGEYGATEKLYRQALAMRQKLYPPARFPRGHPQLAASLDNLGSVLLARGAYAEGGQRLGEALAMHQRLVTAFTEGAAEAEALNYLAAIAFSADAFLSATAPTGGGPVRVDAYPVLWQGRAALLRALQGRQHLLRGATDPQTRRRARELLDVRQRLARLLLAPATGKDDPARDQLLAGLARKKEDLEKELARRLPALASAKAGPADLAALLPARAAFIDLLRYQKVDVGRAHWGPFCYAAFVLCQGDKAARRVELGSVAPIEEALRRWREDIAAGRPSKAAGELRALLWDKLEAQLPPNTNTVYLCPDGPLSALPWAALPGKTKDTVLLEQYAFALVPHGHALLDGLRARPDPQGPGTLLALGAAAYGESPAASAAADKTKVGAPDLTGRKLEWPELPGTARELDAVLALAGKLTSRPEVIALRQRDAATAPLLAALPKARWAHLATHGFFAAPKSEVRKELLDDKLFTFGVSRERRGVGARNPLTQAGLVLAGANLPAKGADSDRGILTAEALAGLDLSGLRLAVLSACETGLGEAATDGGGVFGLQRAFHLGGCRDVLASLWKVEDEPTAALMTLFYHHLWVEQEPPLQALRKAQLALYRHPKEIAALASLRGPTLSKTVRRVTQTPSGMQTPRSGLRAPVRHWAAFVLSGPGR